MATKKLDLYKLGVVLDVDGAKGLTALKATDKELKAVDQDARRAERSIGIVGGTLNKLKSFTFGSGGGGGLLPGLSHISQIIQGIPQIGNLAHSLVAPLKDAAEEGVRFNMLIESAEVGFEGITGGAKESARYVKQLTDFAAANPIFNTQGTIRSARMMSIFGFETLKTTGYLKSWGSAIAAGTGSLDEEKLQGVVTAFGQMRAKGKVSAEEMNQLAERGIPAWQLLAKAIGKTTSETMKLSEQGKLNGAAAVDAITAMLDSDPRFAGSADKFAKTLEGRLAQVADLREVAQGQAARELTNSLNRTLEAGLTPGNQQLVFTMANSINQMLTPVAGMIEASAKGLLGGGITTGLSEGIKAGRDLVTKTVGDFALDTVISPFKKMLGINSPSTVFAEYGENVAQGFEDGVVDRTSRGFDRWALALEKAGGDVFIKGVEGIAKRLGIDPAWLLNVMAFESGISAKAANKGSSARGLIQFMNPTAKGLGLSGSNAFLGMHAMEQLQYVERYYKPFAGKMRNQGDVYAAVAAGRLGGSSGTLFRAGSKEYRANRGWDANRDGIITSREIGGLAANRGGFRSTGDVSAANPLPVMIMGGAGIDFSAGGGGSFNPGAAPKVLERARKELTQTIQDTVPVVVNVQAAAEELIDSHANIAGVERLTFQALLPLPKATQDATVAVGQFAKTVITSGQDMSKKLMSALAGIGGMMPQQQVGKKRGFLSKLLGVAAPFLSFIPGAGPILSTLAGIGSSALGGDWGGALMATAGGFASGGAFRGSSSGGSSTPIAPQTVNFTNPSLPRRARGGPVSGGRAYMVGEERAEVFTPDEDGFIHPSLDAFRRSQGSGGGGGMMGGDKGGFWNQWRDEMARLAGAIEKFETLTPGEVLTRGAKTHPGAIGDGLMRAGTRDPKVVEWMQRRTS